MAGNKRGLQTGSQELPIEGKLRHQLKHGTRSARRSQGSRNQQCASLDPQEMLPGQVAPPSDPQEGCEQLGCAGLGHHSVNKTFPAGLQVLPAITHLQGIQ